MYKKVIVSIFIGVLVVGALWLMVRAGIEVYAYTQWKVKAEAVVNRWTVEELKGDQFALYADYTYTFQGKNYNGRDRLGRLYPNPWAAQEAKERLIKESTWSIWLNPKHPGNSVLEKTFPMRRAVSAAVLAAIVVYFFVLIGYVRIKR